MAALQLFTKSNNKYYNIDTILMEQEAVPCEFLTDVIKLGHWDPSSHSPNLAKQTRVEAPLWMAESLVENKIVRLHATPKAFNARLIESIKADATVLNFSEWCPYFYSFGLRYATLSKSTELSKSLLQFSWPLSQQAFSERYSNVMALSQNALEDASQRTRIFDRLEYRLFQLGLAAQRDKARWATGLAGRLQPAPAMARKRKQGFE